MGVLHRDLKPENVLMSEHDCPVITDFETSKQQPGVNTAPTTATVTVTGLQGTLGYIAPEVELGHALPSHTHHTSHNYHCGSCSASES
jgi:serine/threonine-protein kinase